VVVAVQLLVAVQPLQLAVVVLQLATLASDELHASMKRELL
jgi:hypothetical protein